MGYCSSLARSFVFPPLTGLQYNSTVRLETVQYMEFSVHVKVKKRRFATGDRTSAAPQQGLVQNSLGSFKNPVPRSVAQILSPGPSPGGGPNLTRTRVRPRTIVRTVQAMYGLMVLCPAPYVVPERRVFGLMPSVSLFDNYHMLR